MHPKPSALPKALGIASLALGAAALPAAPAATPPNIMFILIDDLGWGDIGVYGQKFIDTPNFDRLASQCMTLTHAYAPSPICSASRASSLTGRAPARLHFEFVTKPDGAKSPAGAVLEPPPVALDGMSILPLLAGRTQTLARDTLTWHFPFYHPDHVDTRPCSSIRKGGMKLIYFYEDERAELYNLTEDPQESRDLAKTQPELAAQLRDALLSTLKAQCARFPARKG
jgi:uncharacterized sulfatase